MTRDRRRASRIAIAAAALALATFTAPAARAQLWATPTQRVLFGGRTAAEVRARLAAHADSARARAPLDAGEAWSWVGVSHLRSGHPDSARVAWSLARTLREMPDDAYGLAEALLADGRPADADSAARLVSALAVDDPAGAPPEARSWLAWAHARLAGPESARAELEAASAQLLAPATPLAQRERWARRLAPLLLEAHADAWPLLQPLVVLSRGRDDALLRAAREAAIGRTGAQPFAAFLAARVRAQDSLAGAPLRGAGGRPLAVRGADGAALGAWLFPAPRPGAPLVALLADAGAPAAADGDSLVVQLRREGAAVALLEPRGTGRSAIPGCALADDWSGRQDALAATVAHDLSATIGAALAAGGIDSRRISAGGVGASAWPAALAARADARIGSLVFVDPAIAPTDRGPLIAALAQSGVPAFFQTGPASVEANWIVDRVVAMLPARQSRVAEAMAPGSGLALFRTGPAEAKRLSGWLRDSWSTPRATPPARPR